jgi:hypothetical protein
MEFDLKLKALTRLAQSQSEAARLTLQKEIERISTVLKSSSQYEALEQSLKVLEAIGDRFSGEVVKILIDFIQTVESRQITQSQQDQSSAWEISKYHNASSLIVLAVDALRRLKYLETKVVLRTFMTLSENRVDSVRRKAIEELRAISEYEISVFYGVANLAGVGAAPQREIVEEIESLTDMELGVFRAATLTVIQGLLSPTVEGHSWSSTSWTLSRSSIPADPTVSDVRLRSIEFLKRMYRVSNSMKERLAVVSALNDATRGHLVGSADDGSNKMIARGTLRVLDFFLELIANEHLQIVQKIEADSYWIYFHAGSSEVEAAALKVEVAIGKQSEYQIYKVLIGFDGVFGEWRVLKGGGDEYFEEREKYRKAKASEYAESVTSRNFARWRKRILNYAGTESDDLATFPTFYEFLGQFASAQPKLALRLISDDSEQMQRFLIPLFRSLSSGSQANATRSLLLAWIDQGRYLNQAAKQFMSNKLLDRDLLSTILSKAIELGDINTIATIISVAVSNYVPEKTFLIEDFFLQGLEALTKKSSVIWVFDSWFRRELRALVNDLDSDGADSVILNLTNLQKIDYHSEEILYLIAQRMPEKVLSFLCQRLDADESAKRSEEFEAIPYKLHKLNEPLSKIPEKAVQMLRAQYNGKYGMFIFRGAKLLKSIFPEFAPQFERELTAVVRVGEVADLEFATAVLRNYHGQPFIHDVCKEVIRSVPHGWEFRSEIALALESTGVVTGEFGIGEAYSRKKSEILGWLDDADELIRSFAKSYIEDLENMIAADKKRGEERIALRKHRFGELE